MYDSESVLVTYGHKIILVRPVIVIVLYSHAVTSTITIVASNAVFVTNIPNFLSNEVVCGSHQLLKYTAIFLWVHCSKPR